MEWASLLILDNCIEMHLAVRRYSLLGAEFLPVELYISVSTVIMTLSVWMDLLNHCVHVNHTLCVTPVNTGAVLTQVISTRLACNGPL